MVDTISNNPFHLYRNSTQTEKYKLKRQQNAIRGEGDGCADSEMKHHRMDLIPVIREVCQAITAIEFPPMQKDASFNLDAVKAKIEEAIKHNPGQ